MSLKMLVKVLIIKLDIKNLKNFLSFKGSEAAIKLLS